MPDLSMSTSVDNTALEPSDLAVAISVAQQLLDSDQVLSLREALRLLLRALGAQNGELHAAIRTAQKMLAAYGDSSGFGEFGYAQAHGAITESLRIVLRALGAEDGAA